MLTAPLSFTDLYHGYADSWRVQPNEALLAPDKAIEPGIPAKPFYASDLDPQEAARVRAICTAAGVTTPAHLEACTLDTAVLGDERWPSGFSSAPLLPALCCRVPPFEPGGRPCPGPVNAPPDRP